MTRSSKLLVGMSLVVLAIAAPEAPRAEGTSWQEDAAGSRRALNGHIFTPSFFIVSPFSTTHLGSIATYAYASATGPKYNLRGDIVGERTYDLAGFGDTIQYQYRFANWLAVRVAGNVLIYSGVDGKSALAAGASFRYNFSLGLTSGLQLGQAMRLAAIVDVGFQPAIDLTIAEGILRAIQAQSFGSADVFVLGKTIGVRPGLSFAWAPHRVVGIQAEVRYVYTAVEKSSSANETTAAVDGAALVDVDFATISSVSVALTALFRWQEPVSSGGHGVQDAGFGIFYTGRPHLAAGVAVTEQWFHLRPTLDAKATLAQLLIRYYW